METQRKLGLGSGVAVCMGLIVATSCLVSLGQGFGLAGKDFILAMVIVAVLNAFVALSFSELNFMMPKVTGGLGQYMLVGLGPWASIVSNVSAYAITNVFAISVELALCGFVLSGLFTGVSPIIFSLAVLLILFTLNLFGINIFAKVQAVMVSLLIGSMIVLGILGMFHIGVEQPVSQSLIDPPVRGIGGIISLSALAFWLFIGVEFIIPVSKDLKNPKRTVPLSMLLALLVLLIVQSVLGTGMSNYIGTEELLSFELPHIVYAERLLGRPGFVWMSLVTLLAAASTLNTVLPTVGRILQGMADEGMLPKPLRKVNKYNAPWLGMSLMVIAVLILVMSGLVHSAGLINMLLAGSCFWIASYVFTHLNVLVLRRRYPNAIRNKKLILGGIPQIIGMIGCLYMIWNISDDPDARIMIFKVFGILFVLLGFFAILWVKGSLKSDLFKPVYIGRMNIDRSVNVDPKSSL